MCRHVQSQLKEAKHDLIGIPETSEKKRKVLRSNNNNEDKGDACCIDILIWAFPYHLLISICDLRHTTVIQPGPIYCIFVIVPVLETLSPIPRFGSSIAFLPGGASRCIILSSRNFEVPIQKRNTFEVQFKIWLCLHNGVGR